MYLFDIHYAGYNSGIILTRTVSTGMKNSHQCQNAVLKVINDVMNLNKILVCLK